MRGRTRLLVPVAAILIIATGVACGSDGTDGEGQGDGLAGADVAGRLSIEMRDIAFEPARLTVRAGEVTELTARNRGAVKHDFTIDKMDADVTEMTAGGGGASDRHMMDNTSKAMHMAVDAGGQGVMRLRVNEPGEYRYYCTVPGHREAGMAGMLIVQ